MNRIQKIFQTKEPSPVSEPGNIVFLNKQKIAITAVTFDELLEVAFLFSPYLKAAIKMREEYKSEGDAFAFFDVVQNIVTQLNVADFNKSIQILLKLPEESVKELTANDIVKILPIIIQENDLVSVFFSMRSLGLFE